MGLPLYNFFAAYIVYICLCAYIYSMLYCTYDYLLNLEVNIIHYESNLPTNLLNIPALKPIYYSWPQYHLPTNTLTIPFLNAIFLQPQSQLEVLRSSIAFIIVCYVLLVTWKEILQNFRLWCYSQYYDVTQNKMLKIESGWYVGLREWKIPFHSCFLSSCGYILSRLYQSLSYLSSKLVFILSKKKIQS